MHSRIFRDCDRLCVGVRSVEIRRDFHGGQHCTSWNLPFDGRVFVGGAALAGEVLTMTANGWLQIGLFFIVLLAVTKPLGVFMARVFAGEKTFLDPVLRPLERLLYRVCGVDEKSEMDWKEYTVAMLLFSGVSMALLYGLERVQQWLPWNPQHFPAVPA